MRTIIRKTKIIRIPYETSKEKNLIKEKPSREVNVINKKALEYKPSKVKVSKSKKKYVKPIKVDAKKIVNKSKPKTKTKNYRPLDMKKLKKMLME